MAPEQVDRGRLTEKTDIYNFGAAMYFLFTGRHVPALIPAPGDPSHFIGPRDPQVPPVRSFNPSVPEELDEMILQCVKNDARRVRPASSKSGSPRRSGQEVFRWLTNRRKPRANGNSRRRRRSSPGSSCSSASAPAAWARSTAPSSSAWTASSRSRSSSRTSRATRGSSPVSRRRRRRPPRSTIRTSSRR